MAQTCPIGRGGACPPRPGSSDVHLFCYCERIVDLDPEVSDGAFDLGVPEQELLRDPSVTTRRNVIDL
jgi:hypothetical protein